MLMTFTAKAGVSFRASAPSAVGAGQNFQLVYTINETGKDFRLPSLNGFEVLAGPYTSTSQSMSIINGKATSSKEIRYTYTLQAQKEGTFTIAAATIVVDGQKYSSNPVTIKVLPEDKAAQATGNGGRQSGTSANISGDRIFVKASFSRVSVMEQEPIMVSYKLYTKDDVAGFESVKLPDFKDFLVQEIELPRERGMQRESLNGQQYLTYEIYRGLIFPQHAGTITVDKFKCTVDVRVRVQQQARGFFDSFFDSYQDVEKDLSTAAQTITVKSLPQPKPADFSGMVGSLKLTKSVSATEVKSNEPITVKLTLSGTGNLKLLKTPELKFPADFEAYEPKVVNDFTTTSAGQQGHKEIEYLVIPRHKGDFTVPSTTLSYYDVNSNSYKTLETGEMNFHVLKGEGDDQSVVVGNIKEQEKVEMLAHDIRYLNTDKLRLKEKEDYFAGTALFWLSYLLMLIVTVLLAIFFRKQARDNANTALMKNRKANKMARKRLKVADAEWKAGNKERFYDEVLKALWGYVSDKLSIPVAELNKENISQRLEERGTEPETVGKFVDLLNECEFQRYAPISDEKTAMDNTFEEAIDIISKLEDQIRR